MNKRKVTTYFLIAVDILAVCVVMNMHRMAVFMLEHGLGDCAFAKNGILCPSCGGTRCIRELGKGKFLSSFMYNPCVFIFFIYLALVLLFANLGYLFNLSFARKIFKAVTHFGIIIAFAAGFAVFGIVRNFT